MRKSTLVVMAAVIVALTFALAYGVQQATAQLPAAASTDPATATATPSPSPRATRSATPTPTPTARPTPRPTHRAKPVLRPGKRLLGAGDGGASVRDLQARLKQIGWFAPDVTDHYGSVTTAAVRGFQAKRRIPVTGWVDRRTLDRLHAMTHTPTEAELHNRVSTSSRLDSRCTTGRALCIDKSSQTLRWVVDGRVLGTYAVRFGAAYSPTREGLFHVGWKSANHVSKLYGSAMPYSMFFSGGQAVHYSSDFAARGYAGASHGCVNVRDYDGIRWLFGQVALGDKVVVYRA